MCPECAHLRVGQSRVGAVGVAAMPEARKRDRLSASVGMRSNSARVRAKRAKKRLPNSPAKIAGSSGSG